MLEKTTAIHNATFKPEDSSGREYHRGQELNMLCVNYRRSSIVVDDEAPDTKNYSPYNLNSETAARAGDRAPDAPSLRDARNPDQTTRLFDIFGPKSHTVLVFSQHDSDYTTILAACSRLAPGTIHTCLITPRGSSIDPRIEGFDRFVRDEQGHAFANYRVADTSPRIFTIRPDGVIGAAVGTVQSLNTYLTRIFESLLN